jgi:hypothetical protein
MDPKKKPLFLDWVHFFKTFISLLNTNSDLAHRAAFEFNILIRKNLNQKDPHLLPHTHPLTEILRRLA